MHHINLFRAHACFFSPFVFVARPLRFRHAAAHERQQAHRRVPPRPLLQGVGLLRRTPAVATGDRAADGQDPERPIGACPGRGVPGCADRRSEVGGDRLLPLILSLPPAGSSPYFLIPHRATDANMSWHNRVFFKPNIIFGVNSVNGC